MILPISSCFKIFPSNTLPTGSNCIGISKNLWRIKGESVKLAFVDEGRKRVLLIAASILAARKLAQYDAANAGSCNDQRDLGRDSLGRADHGRRKAFPLLPNASYDHFDGRVSPDAKWIAYVSAESGLGEVYVTSFPRGIGKWQISSGGVIPAALWGANGRELYFVSADGNLMVASIRQSAGSITVEGVHPLFRSPFITARVNTMFDVDPKDSQRFIGFREIFLGTPVGELKEFFDQAQRIVSRTDDPALRNLLRDTLATRDQITADLAKGDAAALSEIQPVLSKLEQTAKQLTKVALGNSP